MKVQIKNVNGVFAWGWQIPKHDQKVKKDHNNSIVSGSDVDHQEQNSDDEDDEEDFCGICRASFIRACPNCKFPSDGCPIVIGKCKHNFHVHCIFEWLETEASRGLCPMCRQVFELRKGVVINDLHYVTFKELILKRQKEQNEFEATAEDDEALARMIAAQEGNNGDVPVDDILDQDMVVR
ncbi:hypothetical protein TPHA_0H00640 [Tetrapisispora phaffii CBS 4417]|uniref:Anaphase-promoting complex subunit 11 n=1 Tax=Tetrapisispora phaffii (strain ATCC 24235 / CBS 4417 / NBRC 1672 / NRRL Y-8282 / UCD 70-5) TaxID=1071381 RepID=G8BWX0_TETPH|nr:hypothetical protein TPHA_0H00640 [Tetrapisispora phaffii CBS 4417]CCE64274.1 hypothetical protein TPHA_0H00640 [Tetrapisispora phaffii CBS 4417]